MVNTHLLESAEADIGYDVHGPLPTADGRPPLFMIGQPMDSCGHEHPDLLLVARGCRDPDDMLFSRRTWQDLITAWGRLELCLGRRMQVCDSTI